MMSKARTWVWMLAVATLPMIGCKGMLDVDSPGRIADDDLNTKDAIPGLVVGMSYDVAAAHRNSMEFSALAAGELWHGGSYNWGDVPRGVIKPEDVNGEWSGFFKARFTTSHGIERIRGILPENEFNISPDVARAYLLAGFANRIIGEMVCETLTDQEGGGVPEPNTAEFDRGIANFAKAIEIGTAAGSVANSTVIAAHAGRASLLAWKGDWTGAVADAAVVPVGFNYDAALMPDGLTNTLWYETHSRFEYTVYSTEFEAHPNDTRAPWTILHKADGGLQPGADGATPMYQQNKYDEGYSDNIPLTKGTEMLVLRAEAALRNNDLAGAYVLMNQARAQASMPALVASTDPVQAWTDLHFERGAITWLENRRLWDERRWLAETGPAHFDFLATRDKCVPISDTERRSNPNIP